MRLLNTSPIAAVGRGTCTRTASGPRSGGRPVSPAPAGSRSAAG